MEGQRKDDDVPGGFLLGLPSTQVLLCRLQMRFPGLLLSNLILIPFTISFGYICEGPGWYMVGRALVSRACAFAVGVGLEYMRRRSFMREVSARTQH
jgi:hypothetical protein